MARFLSLTQSKLRLCSTNHRTSYFSNLACDWLSIAWAYSKQVTEIRPRSQWVVETPHFMWFLAGLDMKLLVIKTRILNCFPESVTWRCTVSFWRNDYNHLPYRDVFPRKCRWRRYPRADSRFAPSQWEMALLCNDVSHWLCASLESALYQNFYMYFTKQHIFVVEIVVCFLFAMFLTIPYIIIILVTPCLLLMWLTISRALSRVYNLSFLAHSTILCNKAG